jgi:hypothetical protein
MSQPGTDLVLPRYNGERQPTNSVSITNIEVQIDPVRTPAPPVII